MYEAGKTALVLGLAIAAISSLFLVVFPAVSALAIFKKNKPITI
jgi:hypothetical protein